MILGKSVLIADMISFINRYPERPLIYNVAWKSTIYLLVSIVIHYLERLYDFSRQAGGLLAGNGRLLAETVWPHFWAIEIVVFILIVIYCTMHELAGVLGRDKFRHIFFGPLPVTVLEGGSDPYQPAQGYTQAAWWRSDPPFCLRADVRDRHLL